MMTRRFFLRPAHAFGVAMAEIACAIYSLAMMHIAKIFSPSLHLVIPGKCPTGTIACI